MTCWTRYWPAIGYAPWTRPGSSGRQARADRGASSTAGHLVSAARMPCTSVPMQKAAPVSTLYALWSPLLGQDDNDADDSSFPTSTLTTARHCTVLSAFQNASHCRLPPCRDKKVPPLSGIRAPRAMLGRQPRQGRRASRHALVSRNADHQGHCLA